MSRKWVGASLGEIAVDVSYGYTESANEKKVGPRFLRITDIQGGVVNWNTVPYCPISKSDWEKYKLECNDILVARTGNSTGENYLFNSKEEAVYASYLIRFRLKIEDVYPQFVWYNMRTYQWWKFIENNKTGSAQAGANAKVLSNFKLNLPPLPEQKAIAHILGTLDHKIELNRKMNETLEAMAQALFKSWFVDFDPVLDKVLAAGNPIPEALQAKADKRIAVHKSGQYKPLPKDIQDLFPATLEYNDELGKWIPEGWEVGSVGDEFNVTMGQSPPGSTYNTEKSGIPFFQGKTDFGFRFPANRIYCTAPKRLAQMNDTLISVRAPVGATNLAHSECAIGRGLAALRHKSDSISFTYYCVLNLKKEFDVYEGEGTVFGSINQNDLKSLSIINSSSDIIAVFDSHCSNIDKRIELNSGEIASLTITRDLLLSQLISGKTRLPKSFIKTFETKAAAAS